MIKPDLIETSRHILKIHDVKDIQTNVSVTHILSKTECVLWMSGTQHTQNIKDPQISILKKQFTNFINQNYKNPILCLEGFIPNELKDEEDAVQKNGEKAVLILMAQKQKINIVSVEPTQAEISEWAMQIFPDPLAHAAWAALNVLACSKEITETVLLAIASTYGFEEDTKTFFEKISAYLRRENIVNLPHDFKQLTKELINKTKINEAQEPNNGPFPTNKAGSAINLARDYGLFINTINIIEQNKNDGAFAWFGLNHVLAMMPAFEKNGFKNEKAPFISE